VNDKAKYIGLVIIVFVIPITLLLASYEGYMHYRHYRWKQDFDAADDPGKRLSVPSDDEVLLWEYRPNWKYVNDKEGFSIQTNNAGFRGDDFTQKADAGIQSRIAFIGDSNVLGLRVNHEDTFVKKYEDAVNTQAGKKIVEAMNFGVAGYNINQVYELLKTKTLNYEIDTVVYLMSLNDFNFTDASGEYIRYYKKPGSFILKKLNRLFTERGQTFRTTAKPENYTDYTRDFHLYYFEKNKEASFRVISRMKQLLDSKGIDFKVFIIPVHFMEQTNFDNYLLKNMHREIMDRLVASGIDARDLLEEYTLQKKNPENYYLDDMWHPSPEGHTFIATQLLEWLQPGQ
jgi:lysophospholipase L1-like esterase